ncbi:MAG: indolepyruvate oxidoreductase subunit beta family protein, partial [Gammaproteobacteria bacterium]|nr:indolepyruvate oxidoreductase subunit beta family protein [Gammaproteobacteria bacterium]
MLALGGQGGGVLTGWLVEVAEANGYLAQSTYVAGVAQRTGATIYCVEMFPCADLPSDGRQPVFTPYPVPGDVDLVIAGEMAEAGRAILKGFVTPNITTLIASSHRDYSIEEKTALGDGIIDQTPVAEAAHEASRRFLSFDMARLAADTGSVISAVLLGAVAASGVLPFDRAAFEKTIRRGGKAVDANLRGFAAGYDRARSPNEGHVVAAGVDPEALGPAGTALLGRVETELPSAVQPTAGFGALRSLDFQDRDYADVYLERVIDVARADAANNGDAREYALTSVVARLLALQMCYEDTIRVAEIKTSRVRLHKVREHLNVADGQPAYLAEYFHPRYEEFCDTLPAGLGQRLLTSRRMRRWLRPLFRKGRTVQSNKIGGFLLLFSLSKLRRWRRGTFRYAAQNRLIDDWLRRVLEALPHDYDAALALASSIEIVRGYGDTWERGRE